MRTLRDRIGFNTYLGVRMHGSPMDLETRKVQKLGYSSVGISLPKAWANENGLKPGSIITLTVDDDGTLRVRAGPVEDEAAGAEATIDADAWPGAGALPRGVAGDYVLGRKPVRVAGRG